MERAPGVVFAGSAPAVGAPASAGSVQQAELPESSDAAAVVAAEGDGPSWSSRIADCERDIRETSKCMTDLRVGRERDAARALMAGEVDAACMIDGNHLLFSQEGTLPAGQTRILAQTAPYDHCCFTILDDAPKALIDRFVELIMGMSFDDPEVRPLLELEGLKQWRDGRVSGFAQLNDACDRFGYLDGFLAEMAD